MKLAPLRRRIDLTGVSGVARLDRRTGRLATRLNPGDIAVIDHVDLDRRSAEVLLATKPAAVINAQPSISGRYPNLGPQLVVSAGVVLLDNVGAEIFGLIKEGTKIRVAGESVYLGDDEIATGTVLDTELVECLMLEARSGVAAQLEAFAVDTGEFLGREQGLLIDGDGIPEIRTGFAGRHAVIAVRGANHQRQLKSLKPYIREFKPVLVGVDGGADALLEAGLTPHVLVGDMDAVSDAALASGAEIVVQTRPDGRSPGLARVQDFGIDPHTLPSSGTSEDAALLLAADKGADLVVTVGSHADLPEFLDRGRDGMASAFLTRLRLGDRLMDARGVQRLYRPRISAAALLMLVLAALIAIIAALALSDAGRTYLGSLRHDWDRIVHWAQDTFS